MSHAARDLLIRGIASAKAKEYDLARRYLQRCLHLNPNERQRADAYLWLARLSETEDEKKDYLERVLEVEPSNFNARRDLAVLQGDLAEEDVIDPASPPPATGREPVELQERRFVCPQCGGRMEYEPRNHHLTCRYCGHQSHLAQALAEGAAVAEENFIQALATAKGHTRPQATPTFECEACGATYLLAPGTLSLTCAHCGSTYVIDQADRRDLIPPAGLVPFNIGEEEAGRRLRQWLQTEGIERVERLGRLRGFYLPAWTFDVTGEAPYQYERREGDDWVTELGNRLILHNDLPIPASHRLPKQFAEAIHDFDLGPLQPYDASQLAGWPAEMYEIAATDAAMAARWHVIGEAREAARSEMAGRGTDLQLRGAELLIAAYRLVLLPIWLTEYTFEGESYRAMINGQSGAVQGERPPRRLLDRLGRWLGLTGPRN